MENAVKLSRWAGPIVRKNTNLAFPPRYTEREFNHILSQYRERTGWHKGARVGKRS
jgi:hypothetical protein